MADARLVVARAGPLVSFQDAGRPGHLRYGVSASGPMDRLAHAAANLAIGNDPRATAIEVSLGGLTLDCLAGRATVAVSGGSFLVDVGGEHRPAWSATTVQPGQRLTIKSGTWGSWAYVAVSGEIDVPHWLGSTSTHSMSGFGGGVLRPGDDVVVRGARVCDERAGAIPIPDLARPTSSVRVVMGPQDRHLDDAAVVAFRSSEFELTDAYDRMGVRLAGPLLALDGSLSIPSEPIMRGSIQVAGDGVPTVLLADHQTTGGYPKIATVLSCDLDRFVQHRAGDAVRFEAVSPADAIVAARAAASETAIRLAGIAEPGRTLEHRLRAENLIGGAVTTDE
ncbi:MAG: biotin-dependent carboxyltransferase family protein [Ilumatobacteraceae bacterium]